MEELLENSLLKHYYIISFLLNKDWMTIDRLAQEIKIPARTIRQDIGNINQYIAPAKIESSQRFGIRLTYDASHNPLYIYAAIYRQSTRFLILEELFLHRFSSMTQLAEELFISESTLKRHVLAINQVLEHEGFRIDTQTLDIVGDEKKIHFFYYCYFLERYWFIDAFLSQDELQLIDEIIADFSTHFPVLKSPRYQSFSFLNKLRTTVFICLTRNSRGHTFKDASLVKENDTFSPELRQKITRIYRINCSSFVFSHLFYLFFNSRNALTYQDLLVKARHNPVIHSIYQALSHFLDVTAASRKLKLANRDLVLLRLYNAIEYTWGPTKILYNPDEAFFMNMNKFEQTFIKQTKETLIAILRAEKIWKQIDEALITRLLFILVTSWDNLTIQLEEKAPKVRTGLFFNTSFEHSQFLLQELSYHMRSSLKPELMHVNTLAKLKAAAPHFDMIITNLPLLNLPKCHIVSIQPHPTPEDFDNILAVYNKIISAKTVKMPAS